MKKRFLINMFRPNLVPLIILMALRSAVTGFFFVFPGLSPEIKMTVLYQNAVVLDVHYWGWMVLLSGLLVFVTALMGKYEIAKFGAFYQAIMWLFAAVTYAQVGSWFNLIAQGIMSVLIWSYFYLTMTWMEPLDKSMTN